MVRQLALVLVIGILIGLGLGKRIWTEMPTSEAPAPQINLNKGGDKVLERSPSTTPPPVSPIGGVVERVVNLTVIPKLPTHQPEYRGEIDPPCLPVNVSVSLIKMKNGEHRVIVSSEDGTVTGVDIPFSQPAVKTFVWAGGGSYYVNQRTYGVWVERDAGPFRFGAELFQQRTTQGSPTLAGALRAGIRW